MVLIDALEIMMIAEYITKVGITGQIVQFVKTQNVINVGEAT